MTTTATFPYSAFDPIHLGIDENGSTSTSTWPNGTCSWAASPAAGNPTRST